MQNLDFKKLDVRVKRTYSQLFDAAFKLMLTKNFEELSVLEICDEASVHRATFYKHFIDKYDFLNKCLKIKLSNLTFDTVEENYTSESFKSSCMNMFSQVITFVKSNKAILVSLSSSCYSTSINSALLDSIADFIIERISLKKQLKERLGNKMYMLANYYAGAIVGLIKWWLNNEDECTVFELFSFIEVKVNDLCNYFDSVVL